MKRIIFCLLMTTNCIAQLQPPVQKNAPFLLKTNWDQFGRYARYVPENHLLGCWSTALAQIFYYHQLRPSGIVHYQCSKGYVIRDTLSKHPFSWDQFAPKIDSTTPAVAQNNIALFSYLTAEAIRKDFGTGHYLELVNPVGQIEKHFPCKAEFYVSFTEPIPLSQDQLAAISRQENIQNVVQRADVVKLIRREIDAHRPVYFHFGNFTTYGHSTVIDGYQQEGDTLWVHINYGSSGQRSGWYDLFKPIDVADDIKLRAFVTIRAI
ncbi:hypothetical protein GCM10027592_24520 [Spirosoma flavus]